MNAESPEEAIKLLNAIEDLVLKYGFDEETEEEIRAHLARERGIHHDIKDKLAKQVN